MSRYDDDIPSMHVNPLLAILFEAGLLQKDIEKNVSDPATELAMQGRLLRIAHIAEAMHKRNPLPLSVYLESDKLPNPGPIDKEYKFPVIRGGKP